MAKRLTVMSPAQRVELGRRIAAMIVAAGDVLPSGEPNRTEWAAKHPPFNRKYQKLVDWIRGESAPDLPTLRDLADELDVSMDWLVHGFGPEGDAMIASWKAQRTQPVKPGFDRFLRLTWTRRTPIDAKWLEWIHTGYSDGVTPKEARVVGKATRAADSEK